MCARPHRDASARHPPSGRSAGGEPCAYAAGTRVSARRHAPAAAAARAWLCGAADPFISPAHCWRAPPRAPRGRARLHVYGARRRRLAIGAAVTVCQACVGRGSGSGAVTSSRLRFDGAAALGGCCAVSDSGIRADRDRCFVRQILVTHLLSRPSIRIVDSLPMCAQQQNMD